MVSELVNNQQYRQWLQTLKQRVKQSQQKAALSVNSELIQLYWQLGADIAERQQNATWGDKFLAQLSQDLCSEFPDIKGFSYQNLKYIRQWHTFYRQGEIAKQVVSQLSQIPWGHNIQIVSKTQTLEEARYYVQHTLAHGWSRNVLVHQIESGLFQREGQAQHNFQHSLPKAQSDLAAQTLKDPYIFDFLTLSKQHSERELEQSLVENITQFLLELGAGFAYLGKQYPIQVCERDFYIDLLFYHTRLHCYIVVELKVGEFEPEHSGKLNFYIKTVDEQLCKTGDAPTIGLLLCKSKDKIVAEYALSDIQKPMGISEYRLTHTLPDELKDSLPSIETLEKLTQAKGKENE